MHTFTVKALHRPDMVKPDSFRTIFPQLCRHPPLRVLGAALKNQLIVNPTRVLHVDHPALPSQQHMNAPVTIAHARLNNLLDPPLNSCLARAPGLIAASGSVEADGPAGLPDRHAPTTHIPLKTL